MFFRYSKKSRKNSIWAFFFEFGLFFKKTGKPTQPLNLQRVKWFGLCLGFVFSFKAIGLLKCNTLIICIYIYYILLYYCIFYLYIIYIIKIKTQYIINIRGSTTYVGFSDFCEKAQKTQRACIQQVSRPVIWAKISMDFACFCPNARKTAFFPEKTPKKE